MRSPAAYSQQQMQQRCSSGGTSARVVNCNLAWGGEGGRRGEHLHAARGHFGEGRQVQTRQICGLVRCNLVRCNLVRCDLVRCDLVRCDLVRCNLARSAGMRCNLAESDQVQARQICRLEP